MTFLSASQRVPIIGGGAGGLDRFLSTVRGVPRWRDRFPQYGIKVSYWGSGTLKIVIPVENHPQKPENRLADYHPSVVGGVNQRTNINCKIVSLTLVLGSL